MEGTLRPTRNATSGSDAAPIPSLDGKPIAPTGLLTPREFGEKTIEKASRSDRAHLQTKLPGARLEVLGAVDSFLARGL